MIKELVLKYIKENLRLLIEDNKQIYLNKLDEEDRENIEKIINKDVCSLEEINDLLINYFSYELDNDELISLIKTDCKKRKILSKKDKVLLYVIENYLINIEEYEEAVINIISGININDIKEIDKYLVDKEYKDNDRVLQIINSIDIDNYSVKSIISELKRVIVLFKNNLINMELLDIFFKGKIEWCDNYYLQYKRIYNKLMEMDFTSNKEVVLVCLTFIRDIELFKGVKLERKDLICFIKRIEEMGFVLNDGQVNNLLDGFREKYYKDNDENSNIVSLKNKVICEYSKYYSKYFYFKIEEFIEYYNELYDDDFRVFCFDKEFRKLDKNIFDSIFYNGNINESIIVLEEEVKDFNSFKIQLLNYKINSLENEKVYYERYKFYLMYIDKVKEFSNYYEKFTIKYYILKNISDSHRGTFYELFRCYYGDMYKKMRRCGKAIGNSCELLKKEFIEELGSSSIDKRYEVFNKYREYCLFLNCMGILNEKHLLEIMKKYEEGALYTKDKKKRGKIN